MGNATKRQTPALRRGDREAVVLLALRHLAAKAREQAFLVDGHDGRAKDEAAWARIFLRAAIIRAGGGS